MSASKEQELILESIRMGILFVVDHKIRRCNSAAERMFGYGPGELLGQRTQVLYNHEDIFDEAGARALPLLTAGGVYQLRLQQRRKDGSRLWVQALGQAVDCHDPDQGAVWVLEDMSENLAAEQRVQEALLDQQLIFQAVSLGLMLVVDRHIVRCNPMFETIFGYEPSEVLGQSTRIIYPSQAAYERGGEEIYRPILQGGDYQGEWQFCRKDGSLFWARVYGRAIDAQNLSKGSVWVYEDVTEERRIAQELRTAKENADAANHAKSVFLANMSHEIRTPMNAIIGLSFLALSTALTPRQFDYVSKIRQSGQHLLAILNDILDFSKVEAGKLTLESATFDLQAVLTHVLDVVGDKARAKRLSLVCELPPDLPQWLCGDALRLRQILINLVDNAVKFTEVGRIVLALQVMTTDGPDWLLRFELRDTGIGLTPAQMAGLFQSFSQADDSITRQYGGTGLGLAIARRLALLMGGDMGVHSEAGRGSVFWFTARFVRALPPPQPAPVDVLACTVAEGIRQALQGTRVLLVEDNPINQQVAEEILRMAGVSVEMAENGVLAVQRLLGTAPAGGPLEAFDLVLMDMQMPVMDGVTASGVIRGDDRFAQLPIIAMTANALQMDRERCLAAGMNDFVSKPFEPQELWQTLVRWRRAAPAEVRDGVDPSVLPNFAPAPVAVPVTAAASTPPASPPTPAQWAQRLKLRQVVPSLDLALGLRRVAGNAALYLRLLREFAAHRSQADAEIEAALRIDPVAARRAAHTLVGLAGNLGATALQLAAADLEAALHDDGPTAACPTCLLALSTQLRALIRDLQAALPPDAAPAHELADMRAASTLSLPVLQHLHALLAADDPEALDYFQLHEGAFRQAMGDTFNPLWQALASFDFAQALQLLAAYATGVHGKAI
nr:PAS domain-containing hybrid sensor histidine kinase/response regulator [Roseateles koreensis]